MNHTRSILWLWLLQLLVHGRVRGGESQLPTDRVHWEGAAIDPLAGEQTRTTVSLGDAALWCGLEALVSENDDDQRGAVYNKKNLTERYNKS